MKALENASFSTSHINSCMDRSLKSTKGYQGIHIPGHSCGTHSSSFMISNTIFRPKYETSQVIQQVLYFPPT